MPAETLAISRAHGVEVMGVTKGAAGLPEVAKAMLAGGIEEPGRFAARQYRPPEGGRDPGSTSPCCGLPARATSPAPWSWPTPA
ncbi:MAG: hypothetical protein MZV70_54775 [Desulfobacterales bacterium]|nr:hypothetical protein [Desulfobacterales bacterium]